MHEKICFFKKTIEQKVIYQIISSLFKVMLAFFEMLFRRNKDLKTIIPVL